jgi:hemolysin III
MSSVASPDPLPVYLSEETVNMLTHGFGLVLSLVGTVVLVEMAQARGNTVQELGCWVYGATLVALYGASTLSHSFANPKLRTFFRMLDQVCIFLLIAGTFTPFALTYLLEGWLWSLLITMWGFAIVGIFFKVFFRRMRNVATSAYVVMGWIPIVAIEPMTERIPGMALFWVLAGGLLYTAGTLFLTNDGKVRYFHAVWHLFVIAGSICHYIAVMFFVLPWP